MSTQHRDNCVVADDKNKPEIIAYYNNTKSGVDILDSVRILQTCDSSFDRGVLFQSGGHCCIQRIGVVYYDESKLASRQVTRQAPVSV